LSDITIQDPILKNQKLFSKVEAGDLNKYIKTRELFIEYDTELFVDDSILNIPIISNILPLAWLAGSNIYVKNLDKNFKISMDKLKQFFKSIYPKAPFTTEIFAEELIENKIKIDNPDRKTGLLFSGGADSVYSLLTNMNLKPRLIMSWGIDNFPYPERSEHGENHLNIQRVCKSERT